MRTINSVKLPMWADQAQTIINVLVDFDELDEEFVQFTASQNDPEEHGRFIYQQAISGAYGEIAAWTPSPIPSSEQAVSIMRGKRDALLVETDYVEGQTYWNNLTEAKQAEWTTYRNALRDLPANYPNPSFQYKDEANGDYDIVMVNVEWPTKP